MTETTHDGRMTDFRPCPICDVPLPFPADPEGHAEGCPYPKSYNAASQQLHRAARELGQVIVRDFRKVADRLSRRGRECDD